MIKKLALTLAAVMTIMSVNVSAARNPYNEMDFIDLHNETIEDLATNRGITVDEFKGMWGLPDDMPADTNRTVASGYIPLKCYAIELDMSVEETIEFFKSEYKVTKEITGESLQKDIFDYDINDSRAGLINSGAVSYYDGDDILVMVKGKYIDFDVPPVIEDNRVLVPMRNIFTALGAEVYWQGDVQTVIAVRGNDVIAMQLGQNYLYKNNEKIEIPAPSIARDGRVLVPIRAVAEALDTEVFYNGNTKTVVIH